MKKISIVISAIISSVAMWMYLLNAANASEDVIITEGAVECLEWQVETLPARQNESGCAWYQHDKASTRFVVRNHCPARVSGVFTYFRENLEREAVLSVQAFAVGPGSTQEVANPCDMTDEWSYHVSRVSY